MNVMCDCCFPGCTEIGQIAGYGVVHDPEMGYLEIVASNGHRGDVIMTLPADFISAEPNRDVEDEAITVDQMLEADRWYVGVQNNIVPCMKMHPMVAHQFVQACIEIEGYDSDRDGYFEYWFANKLADLKV